MSNTEIIKAPKEKDFEIPKEEMELLEELGEWLENSKKSTFITD